MRPLRRLGEALLLGPIRFYQKYLSPLKPGGPSCRFTPSCSAYAVTADLRCRHFSPETCVCPGDLIDRIYCAECQWWTGIYANESHAAVDYLDHCWPGWRDLPVLPEGGPDRPIKIPKDYPEEWNAP